MEPENSVVGLTIFLYIPLQLSLGNPMWSSVGGSHCLFRNTKTHTPFSHRHPAFGCDGDHHYVIERYDDGVSTTPSLKRHALV